MKNNVKNQSFVLVLAVILLTLASCSRNGSKSGCPGELSNNIVSLIK